MTYSYNSAMPMNYNMPYGNQEVYIQNSPKKDSATGAVIGTAVAGAATGGLIGYIKNPLVSKNGIATDTFAKNVYETFIKKGTNPLKADYEQSLEILNKIDKAKTVSDLKNLFNNNKDAAKNICDNLKMTVDDFFKNINETNLSQNKDIIKENIKISNKMKFQNIKNDIQACWKQKAKTFEKAGNVSQEIYDSIKEASKGVKTKTILKYAAIAGAIGGVLGFIGHKVIKAAKEAKEAQITNQTQTIQQ